MIGGKYAHQHVPVNLRRIIAAESAANDGLAYPFLSISIYLTIEATKREAFAKWFLVGWLCKCSGSPRDLIRANYPRPTDQVILGTLFGAVMGKHLSARAHRSSSGFESFCRVWVPQALKLLSRQGLGGP